MPCANRPIRTSRQVGHRRLHQRNPQNSWSSCSREPTGAPASAWGSRTATGFTGSRSDQHVLCGGCGYRPRPRHFAQ